jgi:hypothetical protein
MGIGEQRLALRIKDPRRWTHEGPRDSAGAVAPSLQRAVLQVSPLGLDLAPMKLKLLLCTDRRSDVFISRYLVMVPPPWLLAQVTPG